MIVKYGPPLCCALHILYLTALDLSRKLSLIELCELKFCVKDIKFKTFFSSENNSVGCKYFIQVKDVFNFAYLSFWFY